MQLILETGPTSEPVTIAELALHLRIDEYDSDSEVELESILESARLHVEEMTSRRLFTQTWTLYLDRFPVNNYIKIPYGNLQCIYFVRYTDSDGTETTMTVNDEYIVELNGDQCGRIVLPYASTWPSFTPYPSNPIKIQFDCGWEETALIPSNYKSAIKLVCGDLYANRESQIVGSNEYKESNTVRNLLSSSRLYDNF